VSQQVGPGFFIQQQVQVDSKEFCKTEDKSLEVSIPKGSKHGDDIVMEGMADQRPGMVPGSVVVRLKQLPDNQFDRDGDHLRTSVTVSLREALLGFRKDVVMPDQSIVPIVTNAVTQPNDVIRVQGEGMPRKDDHDARGDLFVTVKVQLPTVLSSDQKATIADMFEHSANQNGRGNEL
jgi:DnaJ-class molecular chaperone